MRMAEKNTVEGSQQSHWKTKQGQGPQPSLGVGRGPVAARKKLLPTACTMIVSELQQHMPSLIRDQHYSRANMQKVWQVYINLDWSGLG